MHCSTFQQSEDTETYVGQSSSLRCLRASWWCCTFWAWKKIRRIIRLLFWIRIASRSHESDSSAAPRMVIIDLILSFCWSPVRHSLHIHLTAKWEKKIIWSLILSSRRRRRQTHNCFQYSHFVSCFFLTQGISFPLLIISARSNKVSAS